MSTLSSKRRTKPPPSTANRPLLWNVRAGAFPPTDLWVTATAVQFDLPLLARDGHFGRVSQLRWVSC